MALKESIRIKQFVNKWNRKCSCAAVIVAEKNRDYQEIVDAFVFFMMEVRAKFLDAEI